MSYNWVLSEAKHEDSEETSNVQRLLCMETGMSYVITIINGDAVKLEVGQREEIFNSNVAGSIWKQLARKQGDDDIMWKMLNALKEGGG